MQVLLIPTNNSRYMNIFSFSQYFSSYLHFLFVCLIVSLYLEFRQVIFPSPSALHRLAKPGIHSSQNYKERFPFEWKKRSFLVGPLMEKSFPLTISKKKITSNVFLFSRFYRNDRYINESFASSHLRTML